MQYQDEDEDLKMALALSLGQQSPPPTTQLPPPSHAAAEGERLIRRVIPADNSCLFAALAHAFEGSAGRRERADGLRKLVAERVLADPIEYNEATLDRCVPPCHLYICSCTAAVENAHACSQLSCSCSARSRTADVDAFRPPAEYAQWIMQSDNWGGGIEIAVLASHFRVEIAAFDVQTKRVDLFGQGHGHTSRVLLLYDGVHYDLIVKELFAGAPEELDVCVFSIESGEAEVAMAEAQLLVHEAHTKRAFTDTAKFTLRCLVCQEGLVGQEGAMEHAKKTGHGNFCEYR